MNDRRPRRSATILVAAMSFGALAHASLAAIARRLPIRKVPTLKTTKATGAPKCSDLVDRARRNVVAEIDRVDACLARSLSRPAVWNLDRDARTCLDLSVAGDRALLDGLSDDAREATTLAELKSAASLVQHLRPEIYSVAVGLMQDLSVLASTTEANAVTLSELNARVIEWETTGQDMTSVRTDLMAGRLLNSEATLAVPAARDAVLQLTARSTSAELRNVAAEVRRISDLLDRFDETSMLVEVSVTTPVVEPTVVTAAAERARCGGPSPAA